MGLFGQSPANNKAPMTWLKTYYNLILWGLLVVFLVGGGWYIKGKFDENSDMRAQIAILQSQQAALAVLQSKFNTLDTKVTALSKKSQQSFAKTEKGAENAFQTPVFTDNHLTPEQLCYWNDFGDSDAVSACLSDAGVSGSSPSPTEQHSGTSDAEQTRTQ